MKKKSTRLINLLVLITLGLTWASLLYINQIQQQVLIKSAEPLLQSMAQQLARSVDQSLSLKLDYNRDGLRGVYFHEALITIIEPFQVLESGFAWMAADETLHWKTGETQEIPFSLITAPDFLTALQTQTPGSGLFSWQKNEPQHLNSWAPVSIQGYEWMVGVSVPVKEIVAVSGWEKPFKWLFGFLIRDQFNNFDLASLESE